MYTARWRHVAETASTAMRGCGNAAALYESDTVSSVHVAGGASTAAEQQVHGIITITAASR